MKITSFLSLIAVLSLVGCQPSAENDKSNGRSETPVDAEESPSTHDEHAHAEHGPHGGELLELGKEAYHVEVVHNDDALSMHVLDGAATTPVAIAAEQLTVSLKQDGKVESFDLAASPEATDPAGKTSRFTSTESTLHKWLDAGAEGAVTLEIDGKSFTGAISHDHDHAHEHGDHESHDDDERHDHGDHDH